MIYLEMSTLALRNVYVLSFIFECQLLLTGTFNPILWILFFLLAFRTYDMFFIFICSLLSSNRASFSV